MPNKEQSALLVHRENYDVPKGQEQVVHYKIAKLTESGEFIEKPRIVKSRVKLFETVVKRNLETEGYTIEILHHPQDKYSSVVIVDKNVELAKKDAEITALREQAENAKAEAKTLAEKALAEKDAEIAKLKAQLEKAKEKKEEKPKKAKTEKEG